MGFYHAPEYISYPVSCSAFQCLIERSLPIEQKPRPARTCSFLDSRRSYQPLMQFLLQLHWQSHFAAILNASRFFILCFVALRFLPTYAVETSTLTSLGQGALALVGQDNNFYGLPSIGNLEFGFGNKYDQEQFSEVQVPVEARRVRRDLTALGNNQFMQSGIGVGETQWWYFPKESVNGNTTQLASGSHRYTPNKDLGGFCDRFSKGDGLSTVFISLTTCLKPSLNVTNTTSPPDLPQLELYISLSESVRMPGPGANTSSQYSVRAREGYLCADVETDGDIYIGVSAPNSTTYAGIYEYQLAASIDGLFHSVVEDDNFLHLIDSDVNAALLVTNNLTTSDSNSEHYRRLMGNSPPYTIFANNINDTAIAGLQRSYCALNLLAQVRKDSRNVQSSMTTRGLGNKPKEQFYITGLNRSSTYYGIVAVDGNSTNSGNGVIGGGGTVYMPMNFSTKEDDNCAVLFNLEFCSEVAYAVPSNPSIDVTELGAIYDNHTALFYQNFSYSLQQIQCNSSAYDASSMWSLAVNCSDCEAAYKEWLCAVTIPRCADFSSDRPYLQIRNAAQQFINGSSLGNSTLRQDPATSRSRNPRIDSMIKPGPYKEVLPCEDVCYNLVKKCPAALNFACPQGDLLSKSYGQRLSDDDITCSYLGAAYNLSAGWTIHVHDHLRLLLYTLGSFWSLIWVLVM